MRAEIVIGLLSLTGTGLGTLGGILAANKLTNFRIEQLERKVDKHNNLIERMCVVEQSTKSAHHRLTDIEERMERNG